MIRSAMTETDKLDDVPLRRRGEGVDVAWGHCPIDALTRGLVGFTNRPIRGKDLAAYQSAAGKAG